MKVLDGTIDCASAQLKEKVSEDELRRFVRNLDESRNF
jgi:hypothetical protein